MDQLRQMSIFARVAETGSFSATARALGVSNSVVSKYISGLEEKLGVTLIQRNTRHLALTDIGRGYLERCQRIISDVEEADRAASNQHAKPQGTLRINSALSFGLRHLGPVISQYAQACPEVTVDITLDDRRVDILEEAYDLAIRVGELEDSSMIARKFASVRRVCAASPAYIARCGAPQHPDDLAIHNCLTYARSGWSEPWLVDGEDGPVLMDATGNILSNNGDLLLASAVEGAGIISMPDFIVWESIQEGRLVRVLNEYIFPEVGMYAIYPPTRHLSAKIRTFVDTLVAHFSPEPYWLIK
ncbi:MAG: DNA-binding transcriptional LysR family regulator [Paracoccaceae bacterium]|jgi:DNA-binding transcriptional LysR family regulator